MGIGLKMNNFEETIRHSIELMEYVEILEKENKLLKQKLSKTMQS